MRCKEHMNEARRIKKDDSTRSSSILNSWTVITIFSLFLHHYNGSSSSSTSTSSPSVTVVQAFTILDPYRNKSSRGSYGKSRIARYAVKSASSSSIISKNKTAKCTNRFKDDNFRNRSIFAPTSRRRQIFSTTIPLVPTATATTLYNAATTADFITTNDEEGMITMDDRTKSDKQQQQLDTPAEMKLGVLLLNLGGPESSEDVEGFLYNLFADPDIIRLPGLLSNLQPLIAMWISKRRAPKSIAAYNSIGGGSPILKYSNDQARLMKQSLETRYGLTNVQTYIGMRYWHPFTEDALDKIKRDKITHLVILPLYPQFSISTSGSSLRILQEEFAKQQDSQLGTIRHTVVPSWFQREGYLQSMVKLIQTEIDAFTSKQLKEGNDEVHVLFSAHGVPQSYVAAGDPYQQQIEECVKLISERIEREKGTTTVDNKQQQQPSVTAHLSYQSRVGPIEWLRPYTDDVIPQLAQQDNVKNLVVVPISFVSEHIETLEEIDMEYRELAEESGIINWRRVPALNTEPLFIKDMADMVVEALEEPAMTVTEACVANNCGGVEEELLSLDSEARQAEMLRGAGADLWFGAENDFDVSTSISSTISSTSTNIGATTGGVSASSSSSSRSSNNEALSGERINGRLAIFGVICTILLEVLTGKPILHFFDGVVKV